MTESYIDREFVIPACANLFLRGMADDPTDKTDLCNPIFKTKEYSGRKRILFELTEL